MLSQIKEYLINFWIECPVAVSKKQITVLMFVVLALGVFFYLRTSEKPAVISEINNTMQENQTQTKIMIDISGEVKRPGVYEVKEGSRLFEVVKKAGGLKSKADRNGINLAIKVEDGQKIVIPLKSDASDSSQSNLININSADEKELEELPGIGEMIAQRIVDKREADGPFKDAEGLDDVEGIGPKKFEQIKDLISVY